MRFISDEPCRKHLELLLDRAYPFPQADARSGAVLLPLLPRPTWVGMALLLAEMEDEPSLNKLEPIKILDCAAACLNIKVPNYYRTLVDNPQPRELSNYFYYDTNLGTGIEVRIKAYLSRHQVNTELADVYARVTSIDDRVNAANLFATWMGLSQRTRAHITSIIIKYLDDLT
jgi:hypothetical protein